jgi:capsular polysaccharide biosynthesis protein
MELQFCDIESWLARADERLACDLPPYQVRDQTGFAVTVKPFLALCRDTIVLGDDWLPVRADGLSTLAQMVHTPAIYLDKARNLRRDGARIVLAVDAVRPCPDDTVLVGGNPNYYHWLIDYLPRLLLARRYADLRGRRIIVSRNLLPWQREALALLGIGQDQLLPVGDNEAVRPRSTLIPSLLASTTVPHPVVADLLQEAFPPRAGTGARRVYLSREDAVTRHLTNEDALVALLARYGFEKHVPGKLGFQAQIDLCAGAEALVAVHGAAMANVVFSPATVRVFEIYCPDYQVSSMYMLARTRKRVHRFVPAQNVDARAANPLFGTWEVDLGAMEAALKAEFG